MKIKQYFIYLNKPTYRKCIVCQVQEIFSLKITRILFLVTCSIIFPSQFKHCFCSIHLLTFAPNLDSIISCQYCINFNHWLWFCSQKKCLIISYKTFQQLYVFMSVCYLLIISYVFFLKNFGPNLTRQIKSVLS